MEQHSQKPGEIYRRITEQIAAAIAAGAPRFEMPWHSTGPLLDVPTNAISGHAYRGINVLTLWVATLTKGFAGGYWATYRQWSQAGAQVRKGERGTMIVFYKKLEADSTKSDSDQAEEREPKQRLIARASWVFNASQVDNWIDPDDAPEESMVNSLEAVDAFIAAINPDIQEGGEMACYHAHADYISMPLRAAFVGTSTCSPTEAYYSTLLHELTHWTGHYSRLNRDFSGRYGDEAYAMEELVAELGAAFLCAALGVTNVPRLDHAAYVQSWLRVLGNDSRAIFTAASRAQAAVEYLDSLSTAPARA